MRITHLTSEAEGGAGIAAQRLHRSLLRRDVDSRLIYRAGATFADKSGKDTRRSSRFWRNIGEIAAIWQWRKTVSARGLFTSPAWLFRTRLSDFGPSPQVVNLHWISRWIDLPSFSQSIGGNLPVVWSLHDMNPLTGGCHHALDCARFADRCAMCPSLTRPGPRDASWRNFRIKEAAYRRLNLHFVGNSEWTTSQAERSSLGQQARSIRTIHLGVDIDEYAPVDKATARRSLRLPADRFVVCFASADIDDKNKGLEVLLEALGAFPQASLPVLLVFGAGRLPARSGGSCVVSVGNVASPTLQSIVYSAADVFVTCSRIESFGLTALEAMACGTPVAAFRTGGLPEVVEHGAAGLLVDDVGDASGVFRAIQWMMDHPNERREMGVAARKRVEARFTDTLMGERYENLYRELLSA